MSRFDYTPEIDETIRVMWASAEHTMADIADATGLRRNQIAGRIARKRKEEGEERWRSSIPGKRTAKSVFTPPVRSHRAGRPKLVPDTTQPAFVNPGPPRANVKPIRFSLRALNQCAWIEGEPTENALCCGARTVEGKSWCDFHAVKASQDRRGLRQEIVFRDQV